MSIPPPNSPDVVPAPARVHTRFVQASVTYRLETFETSRQFIEAIFDALIAHKSAYEECNVLHRGINPCSILLKKGGGGVLNDWDLAKSTREDAGARRPYRSGTWQFMSAELLLDPKKIHTVQDDMESFFWLMLYHVLRYTDHNLISEVNSVMKVIFDEKHRITSTSPICGGFGKQGLFVTGAYQGVDFLVEGNKPLTSIIKILLGHWHDWYINLVSIAMKRSDAMLFERLSPKKAVRRHPFDPRNLVMYTYDTSLQVFEDALSNLDWPPTDKATDRLPSTEGN